MSIEVTLKPMVLGAGTVIVTGTPSATFCVLGSDGMPVSPKADTNV